MSTADDPLERRRAQRRRQNRNRLIFLGGLFALVCAGAITGVAWSRKRAADGQTGLVGHDPAKWTYKEMAAHLNQNGLPGWEYVPHKGDGLLISPAARQQHKHTAYLTELADNSRELGMEWPGGVVLFTNAVTPDAARQAAGYVNRPSVAYHNWIIFGDEQTVAMLRSRLR